MAQCNVVELFQSPVEFPGLHLKGMGRHAFAENWVHLEDALFLYHAERHKRACTILKANPYLPHYANQDIVMCGWFRGEDNPTTLNHFSLPSLLISVLWLVLLSHSLYCKAFGIYIYTEFIWRRRWWEYKHWANEKTALFCLLWKITITSCAYHNRRIYYNSTLRCVSDWKIGQFIMLKYASSIGHCVHCMFAVLKRRP